MWNFFIFFFPPLCGLVNTGCPERLWTLHSRTCLRALWTWFWVTSCRWPCLSRSVGQPEAPSHLSHSVVTSSVFWGLAQCNSALQTLLDLDLGGKVTCSPSILFQSCMGQEWIGSLHVFVAGLQVIFYTAGRQMLEYVSGGLLVYLTEDDFQKQNWN